MHYIEQVQAIKKALASWEGGPHTRLDGTIEYTNKKHQYHRTDGPAVESASREAWYINGKLHRVDGPAETWKSTGKAFWHVNGYRIDSWEQLKWEANLTDEDILLLAIKWCDTPPSPVEPIANRLK